MMNTRKLVLYADDDLDDLDMMQVMLREYPQYDLHCFPDANALLEFLRERSGNVGLVVLDHNMPLLSGRETLQRIRILFPGLEIPVIVFSTTISPLLDEEICALGGISIQKPKSFLEFNERIRIMMQYCEE